MRHRVFSHDVTAAMLLPQTNPLFLCKRILLFQQICIDAGHVSENTLWCPKLERFRRKSTIR